MGAIASGGIVVLNQDVVHPLHVRNAVIESVVDAERRELERREHRYRGDRPLPEIAGNTVIVVDAGLATGSTMQAAIAALKQEQPRRIVVAVPVAAPEVCDAFRNEVDDVVCLMTPQPFYAVGLWYDDFSQTSDEEVKQLLDAARECVHTDTSTSTAAGISRGYDGTCHSAPSAHEAGSSRITS